MSGFSKVWFVAGVSALVFTAAASAEEGRSISMEWKTPQVVGSAPVREELMPREPQAPRPVGRYDDYGPRRMPGIDR